MNAVHVLSGPGLLINRDVWTADCSCGAEFEHPDRVGLEVLLAQHLVEAGAAVTVAVTVTLPLAIAYPGELDLLDGTGAARALRARIENDIGSESVIHVSVLEGGPS